MVWLAAATGNGRLGAQNRKQAIQKVSFCSAPEAVIGLTAVELLEGES